MLAALRKHLRRHAGTWLLIADNVERPGDLAPLPDAGGHILATSRQMDWRGRRPFTVVSMDCFTADEAVALLDKVAGGRVSAEPEAARALVEDLGSLPLAVAQAAGFVEACGISFARYRSDFKAMGLRLRHRFAVERATLSLPGPCRRPRASGHRPAAPRQAALQLPAAARKLPP